MGFGNQGVYSWRTVQPSDPAPTYPYQAAYDKLTYLRGEAIWIQGTVPSFPWGSRPSFRALMGGAGCGHLGGSIPTFDDLMVMYPPDSGLALAKYIQAGMAGKVHRPEITGN